MIVALARVAIEYDVYTGRAHYGQCRNWDVDRESATRRRRAIHV
jgi:hypothetical protein